MVTTTEPPVKTPEADTPPWGDAGPPKKGEAPPVNETTPAIEGEEEPVQAGRENKIVGSQLTLKVGGPKPVAALLKIAGKQVQYANQQFDQLERIPITAMLEIREVGSKVENNGKVTRTHRAIITELAVDGVLVDDGSNE